MMRILPGYEKRKEDDAYLMLEAICANWALKNPGGWDKVVYHIFSDGTFDIRTSFGERIDEATDAELREFVLSSLSSAADGGEEIYRQTKELLTPYRGKMDRDSFEYLCEALDMEPQLFPVKKKPREDSISWKVDYYDSDAKIIISSNGFVPDYSDRRISEIIERLPEYKPVGLPWF